MKEMCCNCKYIGGPFHGEAFEFRSDMDCARHAPIVTIKEGNKYSIFPEVKGNDWCGDFVSKESL